MEPRNTSKYVLKKGNEIVYVGITNNIERREAEHKADGMDFNSICKIGNKTTREAAENWEAERIRTYMDNHNGNTPIYNKNSSGK